MRAVPTTTRELELDVIPTIFQVLELLVVPVVVFNQVFHRDAQLLLNHLPLRVHQDSDGDLGCHQEHEECEVDSQHALHFLQRTDAAEKSHHHGEDAEAGEQVGPQVERDRGRFQNCNEACFVEENPKAESQQPSAGPAPPPSSTESE